MVYGQQMKLSHILILTGVLISTACKPEERKAPEAQAEAAAQPTAGAEATAASPRPAESVPEALQGIITFNGTPSQNANYYIYLQSASWCSPCCKEMPEIAAAYEEMKNNGVELILIGCDDTVEAAQKFLDTYGAKFPGIHYKESELSTLPGFTPAAGIPDATFVDRAGKVIARDHGYIVKLWKQIIDKYEAQNKPTESPVQAPSAETEASAE